MKYFFYRYQLPIIFGGLGLILAILLVTIGFFKTLLLVLLTVAGIAVGFYLEQSGLLDRYFKS
ncbi:DUF2273 domain-containing protein [Enterococcus asini]|uniref:DUF2273 domain-containing protein n=1 Tax=Enterococcus asini TaxID=57732 RepID=UPI0028915DB4|nr:DUF2273 domain-containing protein [Enterococcus asini]MDT2757657.1 DUF2273 domain-containing protein [Enterococcus asini]